MKLQLWGIAALVLLAGCNKAGNVDLKHASVDDVVKATVTSKTINPGQWSVSTEVISVDMPGLPEKQKAMMATMTTSGPYRLAALGRLPPERLWVGSMVCSPSSVQWSGARYTPP